MILQHPSMAIVKGAGLVMKAIIEEGDGELAAKMQDLALAEGALPRHLLTSMFTNSTDNRALTNRQLSRHLVGLWVTGHPTAMALLKRCMVGRVLLYKSILYVHAINIHSLYAHIILTFYCGLIFIPDGQQY